MVGCFRNRFRQYEFIIIVFGKNASFDCAIVRFDALLCSNNDVFSFEVCFHAVVRKKLCDFALTSIVVAAPELRAVNHGEA